MILAGPRALVAELAMVLCDGARFLFGTSKRAAATLTVAAFAVGFWLGDRQSGFSGVDDKDLATALSAASHFEKSSRGLGSQLDTEKRLRSAAERTIRALSENVREQDAGILELKQRLAFLRQLIEERGAIDNEVDIRGFEINPDFRESSYRLAAVLVRSSGRQGGELFKGRLDLVLSLADANGEAREYRPVFDVSLPEINFQYYNEIDLGFKIPPGTEILNAKITLLNEESVVVALRVLHDIL